MVIKIGTFNVSYNLTKKEIGISVILIVSYLCFLISHFLIWGFSIAPYSLPLILEPFTGLEIKSGLLSIKSLNGLFICSYINFLLYLLKKERMRYYSKLLNVSFMLLGFAIFIYILFGVFRDWEPWVYLDHLVFGFYLWLISVIGSIGVLIYFNFKIYHVGVITSVK